MRIGITHHTTYTYDRPIKALVQVLRLTPRDHDGQHVLKWQIEPSADGRLRRQEDSLGNVVHVFSADGSPQELTMRVTGEVETNDTGGVIRGSVERLPALFYLRETDLTTADDDLRAFAVDAAGAFKSDPLDALHRLLASLHQTVEFDDQPTDTGTTAAESFAMKKGVCQDLSHIFIAASRHLEIPARYVSGYFHRNDGVVDQVAGHAWAEALIPGLGWVGFDPANGISATDAHIRVAIGLDYLGAAPIRGSRMGGGSEHLDVRLSVDNKPAPSQTQHQGQGQSQSQVS